MRIGLETGEIGPRVHSAAERLVADGRTRLLTELLDGAAQAGVSIEAIWGRVGTPELLAGELGRLPVDFAVVDSLVARLKVDACVPLLDALALSEDRSTRWNLMRILGEIGAPAAPAVAARLPDTPWFVQRNLLLLMGRLGSWPEGFSPAPYTSHREPRVRREAFRLLLDSPDMREAAIVDALSDPDPGILTMVLGALLPTCPLHAMPLVNRIAQDSSRDPEVRLLAVKALAGCPDPERMSRLVAIVRQRRWWGGVRLAPKSPVLLAALKGLADGQEAHPDATSVLALAARHRDPEIRATAAVK
jgi:HEAT repeat protein